MGTGRKCSVLAAALLLLFTATLTAGGCLANGEPTPGENVSGGDAPDLRGELQQRIQYVKENTSILTYSIHNMINEERGKEGLQPLQWDQDLADIALSHSRDMATRDYFDHISPEGEDFADRYEKHGYRLETGIGDRVYVGGENLSLANVVSSFTYDQETGDVLEYRYNDLEELARSTVQGWMESQGHRENILTPFTREGIGVFASEEGEVYITENFS
jgi:uncharacterized protein YkwD